MLIRNAKDASGRRLDVLCEGGVITALGVGLQAPDGCETVEANGATVLPSFIDTHVHWRTPGFEYKEDITTGSQAAAAGGFTFVNLMPNTKPVCSSAQIAAQVVAEAKRVGLCDVHQCLSITQNFDGKTLDHLKTMPESIKAVTEDGHGVMNNNVMAKAFAICADRNVILMSHAEDSDISPWDYRLAENIETVRNIHLSSYYHTRLHMAHVSTAESMEAVLEAKYKGIPVTCEVMPHHIWFTDDICTYRVNPPIRKAHDVDTLIQAILAGGVDTLATDHAPHSAEDKQKGAAGMIGSETAFGVFYTKLCRQNGLPLAELSRLMSANPAALLSLPNKGRLLPGYDADLVLVDLDHEYTVDASKMHSKSHNTPFDGEKLFGRVLLTVKGGKTTYRAE